MSDPLVNLFYSELTNLPYATGDTSFTLTAGSVADLPDADTEGAYNLVIWDRQFGSPAVAKREGGIYEIVRVTSDDTGTDTITVSRAQEGTTAQSFTTGATYGVILAATKKVFDDIEAALLKIPTVKSLTNTDSPYTYSTDERVYLCDCSGGDIDINLPALSTLIGTYDELTIKFYKTDFTSNTVDIFPDGTEKIQGMDQYSLLDAQESIEIYPTTQGWIIV